MSEKRIYCLDTSALIHAEIRAYPFSNFGTFWDKMDILARNGRALLPIAARDEIEKKSDSLFDWVKNRPNMIVPLDTPTQETVRDILIAHPRLVDTKKGRSGADPFIIAVAEQRGATLVTQELPAGPTAKSPKIPDVCKERSVEWLNLLNLIRSEEWRF